MSMVPESQLMSCVEIRKATDKYQVLQRVIRRMNKGRPKLRKKISKNCNPILINIFSSVISMLVFCESKE